jgi:ABC-type dipeptide/oligopeptide/nickel transport system permease subunit
MSTPGYSSSKVGFVKAEEKVNVPYGVSLGQRALRKLMKKKFVLACFAVVLVYVLIALVGYLNLLPDYQQRIGGSYEAPSWGFAKILGTDIFGRSVLYKILIGTKTAMTIGFVVTLVSVPIGILLGALAGYFGGKVDVVIVWLYSVVTSVPYLLLLIGIAFVLGKGLLAMCIALGLVNWVGLCRLIRGEVMKHKNREYVLAVKLMGASSARAIFKHILPNVFHLAIVTASLTILAAIRAEVVLTFLGMGIQDGSSWGTMVADASGELSNGIWWPLTGVTVAMFVIVFALTIVGDALRDALDPKIID